MAGPSSSELKRVRNGKWSIVTYRWQCCLMQQSREETTQLQNAFCISSWCSKWFTPEGFLIIWLFSFHKLRVFFGPLDPCFFTKFKVDFPQGPVNSPAGTAGSNRAVRCGCSGRLQVHPEGGCTWHTTHPRRCRNPDERSFRAPRIGESCCNAKGLDARSCKIM